MKGGAVSLRPVRPVAVLVSIMLAAGLFLVAVPAQAATPPTVVRGQIVEVGGGVDLNICGDLGRFDFNVITRYTVVYHPESEYFHVEAVSIGSYTLTFVDPSLGVWEGTIREVGNFQAPPGGTIASTISFNSFEGPVRIHELITYVVGPDGTIRVDRSTTTVVGCP
jgi:hypothetical protein